MKLEGKRVAVLVGPGYEDLEINAGATWTYDEPAFRDGNLVWGRVVPDIPAFCRELVQALGGE